MSKDRVIHVELPFNMTTEMLELDPNVISQAGPRTLGRVFLEMSQDFTEEELRLTLIAAVCLYTHLNGGVGNIQMYGEQYKFSDCLVTARIWMRG